MAFKLRILQVRCGDAIIVKYADQGRNYNIIIELKKNKEYDICLKVCPSTYNQYKTFSGYDDPILEKVFDICRKL